MHSQPLSIHYQVSLLSTTGHLFNVCLSIENPHENGQILTLPAWIPGSYMIRDFAKNIVSLQAFNQDKTSLSVQKLDKQTWQIAPCKTKIHIEYQVYAFDLSVRGAYINDEFAFFNGTNLFLAVDSQTHHPCSVTLVKPKEKILSHWKVATTLPTKMNDTHQFGHYQANHYNELIDHPVLFGEFDIVPFKTNNVEFELILAGGHQGDLQRMSQDLTTICAHHIKFFNAPVPVNRYLFITLLTDNAFGGLEHMSSTALMYSRNDLPSLSDPENMSDGYQIFLSLCSHEFFHTWHVKRIKPEELFNASLSSEQYTEQLWIYEGFTSYYDDLSLLKCGLINQQAYLKLAAQNLTRLLRNKGRTQQTITESSFDAWTKFYKQDEGSINHIVSYYNKGAVIALCLDLLIRSRSANKYCLDDVMRYLWKHHGQTNIPTKKHTIQNIIKDQLGIDLTEFFELALYSTQALPVVELMAMFGVEVKQFARENIDDKGGIESKVPFKFCFGAQIKKLDTGVEIIQVTEGTSAYQAGLQVKDVLIAMDIWQVTKDNLKTLLNNLSINQTIHLTVLRDKKLKQLTFTALTAQNDTVFLQVLDQKSCSNWLNDV
jgi:predicted metalloprotease with PDZ domain